MGARATTVLALVIGLLSTASVTPARGDERVDLGDGAWSWFADPRAVTHTGEHTRTYVGRLSRTGDVSVESYDHATRVQQSGALHAGFQRDDHANPVVLVRADGRIVAFYSGHNGSQMLYRISVNPEDVTTWGPELSVPTNSAVAPGSASRGYTYPNPIHLAGEGRTYLFWRGADYQPTFSTQADGSGAWTPAQSLIRVSGERPYVKYASDEADAIDVAFTNAHPREAADVNIYYARVRADQIERADGSSIGPLGTPIAPAAADKVFDGPPGENAWVHDVARDASGHPIIVFASFPAPGDHRYHYARWTGSSWDVHQITPAGGTISPNTIEEQYSGGITLDHEDPSVVYLSRETTPGVWEVETWTTSDGGTHWTSQAVTSGSPDMNVRPISPRGLVPLDSGPSVIWLRGAYGTYRTYATSLAALWREPVVVQPPAPPSANGSPPAPAVAPAAPASVRDTTRPVLRGLRLSRRAFRASGPGTRLRVTLSEPARVTFTAERLRGKRYARVRGSIAIRARAGANRLTFTGRIGGRRLRPGSYRLNARAVDGSGNSSSLSRISFTVRR